MTSRRPLSERLGKWVFWLMFSGMQITFLPMHLTGLMGMPRRVWTYLPHTDWMVTNLISTVGAFVIAFGVLLFLIDLARNFRFTVDHDAGNTYNGGTLEWLRTGSYSARSIPVVKSREPLWDDPGLRDDVAKGRYLLPFSATGHRETIITSPVRAEPQYLQILPGPSVWPMFSAFFTAGFFLLLVIQSYWPAILSGVLAIACIIRWLWATDRPVASDEADIGAGIRLPTYATGSGSPSWWALVSLLVVIFMVWLMTVFSWFFLYGIHTAFWKDMGEPWWLIPVLGGYGAAAGLVLLGRRLLAREKSTRWSPPTQILFAGAALVFAYAMDFTGWRAAGIDPETSSQSALVMTFLSQQGVAGRGLRDHGAVSCDAERARSGHPASQRHLRHCFAVHALYRRPGGGDRRAHTPVPRSLLTCASGASCLAACWSGRRTFSCFTESSASSPAR
jgi:cytochrome c oxidase subunit I+III